MTNSIRQTVAVPQGRWIPENRATRIPRCHIVLDSESVVTKADGGEVHSFRCAVTSVDRLSNSTGEWIASPLTVHESSADVWKTVTGACRPKTRTVLVAHNLGFDLRVCDAFTHLTALGWSVEHLSLAPGATWLTWKRQGATLSMVDSMTWFPTSLERIGRAIGRPKLPLPSPRAGTDRWRERCAQDVTILRDAWLRTVGFLRAEDCGNWRPTGAGQSWSAWRHKFNTHPILSHDDQEVRAVERRAGWTGRAEAWRFGRQTDGPFTEWDFQCCYAQIAQRCDVPTVLIGEMTDASLAKVQKAALRYAVLTDCNVRTATPIVPTANEGRVVWPVGSFATTLWENELELAVLGGAEVTVTRAWVYRRSPALKAWAEWVLSIIYGGADVVDPVVRVVVKHWARALIGRFGTRYSVWDAFGDSVGGGVGLGGFSDLDASSRGQLLEVGGKSFVSGALTDHPMSAPQVMSWISAQARVDLWGAMCGAGLENVLYVDTDSIIVDGAGDSALERCGVPGLRRKSRYQSLDILGTRRLVEDRKLKAAGVPAAARRVAQHTWSSESWDSLQRSLKTGSSASVRVVDRRVTLRDVDRRRRRRPDGSSVPYEVDV
jgi:hypothetical protein